MFKFIENLKIREIIYRYRDFKKQHPDFNEDQLCRLTIEKRIRDYPSLFQFRGHDNDHVIKFYMENIFTQPLNLKYVCTWFMEEEYPKYNAVKNSSNLNRWKRNANNLEYRIDKLIKDIPMS